MVNEAFAQMVADHYEEARKIANIGREIIETVMLHRGKDLTEQDLYGCEEDEDHDWVWLEGELRLQRIELHQDNTVSLWGQDEWGGEKEIPLDTANRDDIIEVADYLSKMDND